MKLLFPSKWSVIGLIGFFVVSLLLACKQANTQVTPIAVPEYHTITPSSVPATVEPQRTALPTITLEPYKALPTLIYDPSATEVTVTKSGSSVWPVSLTMPDNSVYLLVICDSQP
jgi:hypothetical protein